VRLLSVARDLRRRHARENLRLFVAEGLRTVDELLKSPIVIRGALIADGVSESDRHLAILSALKDRDVPLQQVSASDFASAADTDRPQGILAIAEVPKLELASVLTLPETQSVRVIVLDAVQDPGNAGTIVRTAAALGATATLSLPGTVDLWNGKVVRSSMGALFHHPSLTCTWEELASFLSRINAELWGAEAGGVPLSEVVREPASIPLQLAIAVGNEGKGLSAQTKGVASKLVAVEIGPGVESLNVAVATGILLYELRR
jgi:RNA methyltransferase, TrmH family